MVDPRHFKNFIAVIDSGGIRQAARVVHLSPSSISRSIQFLEEHFGVRLLERQGMHLIPTLHGETLRKEAKGVLSGYESLRIKLKQLDEIESGNLRVGVNPVIAHVYLPEVGARFLRDYPEVRISTSVRDASGLIDLMREGELDLMIGFERLFSLQKDLEITRLFEAAVPWWVRKGHPLLRKRKMAMGDFADYPIISQHLPPLYMERFVDLCLSAERDREVGSVSNAHVVDDYSVLCRMAVQSDAILLCPELHARAGSMADQLRRLEAPIEMPPATISAAWPTQPTPSPLATRFLGILQEEIEAVLGETGG